MFFLTWVAALGHPVQTLSAQKAATKKALDAHEAWLEELDVEKEVSANSIAHLGRRLEHLETVGMHNQNRRPLSSGRTTAKTACCACTHHVRRQSSSTWRRHPKPLNYKNTTTIPAEGADRGAPKDAGGATKASIDQTSGPAARAEDYNRPLGVGPSVCLLLGSR